MARLGDGEHTMSVLERLLANAALRDEAGRLHSPEARAHPPSGGLLGWAQKDLQSEFGIAADTQSSSFSPSSWSQDTSQDYGLRGASPRGDPGLGERNWSSKSGQEAGEGSAREWASRCGIVGHEEAEVHEEVDVGSPHGSGGLPAQDRVIGKPAPLGTQQSQEPAVQDWEFRKRDSQGTFSSRDVELQDQEFGKRDVLGSYSSQDAGLQGWEFGKRDSLGAYASQEVEEVRKKDHLGKYSSQDADEQDQEFGKRDSSLGIFGSQGAEQPDLDFGKSAWMRDYSSRGSATALSPQDRGFGVSARSTAFSPEEAQQQDEEFEKTLSGGDGLGEASGDPGQPEERELGGLFSPGSPQNQDGARGPRAQSSWQDSGASQEVEGLHRRQQAGDQSPGDADPEDREVGQRGWAGDFSLGVVSQPEAAFSPGQRDWSGDFCMEATKRSHHFGIIGHDRVSGAGPSPSGKMGGGHFVSPEKTSTGPVDWTDQLGLRNLEVSSCVGSGVSSEAREDAVGQTGWSDNLRLRDVDLASRLEAGGSEEPREMGVGEKDWTSDVGVRGRDLAGVGEAEGHSQARESGVGQTNWSGVEAGDFLKSRERGVGQASWTPDLGLRNMAVGPDSSSRERGVGQVDWGDSLGLRNLEVPCDPETGGSQEPRGCGVGQMDWTQDLGLRNVELSGTPSEAREHGVGEVSQCQELGLRDTGILCPGQEARDPDPMEARELGVGETSGPETQGEDDSSLSLETCPEDPGMEMEEEETTAGADRGEPLEPLRDRLPSWRPQPDGEASRTEEVDGTWSPAGAGLGEQGPMYPPRRPSQGPPPSSPSQDFSFIEDTEILDSAVYRSRASLGRKRGHRAPAIRPGGTLGLSEAADSDARLFQDSTGRAKPRASRVPSSDEEVVEEPQNRRTRMSLGTKGLKVNLFPGLSPSALKAKLRPRNRSAEEGELVDSKSSQKESAFQRSKSCKVPGLGKPLALPPKPEKSSGSEGSSPSWLQALKLKKKKV
uniref:Tankyrase 1 binding protein 1 n=1 Tax=Myotis myotis TaxID=51298 RepID=A0A7J7VLN9_MYOMY|nr:tankyrase 1 binding protein 1 [Myotis myotis]